MQSIGQAGRVVLIVENEPITTCDLEAALRAVGAAVLRSPNPTAALEAVQIHHIAAAVLVPAIGVDDCAELCATLRDRDVPFIFCTTLSQPGLNRPDTSILGTPASADAAVQALSALVGAREAVPARRVRRATLHLNWKSGEANVRR